MDALVLLFVVSQMLALFIWRYANAILVDTLQHFYRPAHREAGDPDLSFIASPGPFNARWAGHILLLRFRRASQPTKHLGGAFWAAFFSGWYIAVGLVAFVVLYVFGVGGPAA